MTVYIHTIQIQPQMWKMIMDVLIWYEHSQSAWNRFNMTSPGVTGWGLTTPTVSLSLSLCLCVSLFLSTTDTGQTFCCEQSVSLSCWLARWLETQNLLSASNLRTHTELLRYSFSISMSCNFPCVAACAVDSQGRDACRDEGGNKRNQLQRSFLSHQPPPP